MLGREGRTFAKRLAAKLANKWQKSYLEVCVYADARLSIASVRATHLCMRVNRVRVHKVGIRYPQCEDGAELSLFEC
jgi:predicted lipase